MPFHGTCIYVQSIFAHLIWYSESEYEIFQGNKLLIRQASNEQ
jgi:hypothetical protein